MHRILFEIAGYEIRAYPVAMAAAFIINIWLVVRRAPKEGVDPAKVLNACMLAFVGTLVGGRLLFVITQWSEEFADKPWTEILRFDRGGLVFYGGFLGALFLVFGYTTLFRVGFLRVLDLLSPYTGLGLAIHRTFGCFLNGCCYGRPTSMPWGVIYPPQHPASRLYGVSTPVHPTQIYESINGLIIFFALLYFRKRKIKDGQAGGLLLMIYSINRFIIEFFRGDSVRGNVGILSTSQFIGIFVFATGIAVWFIAKKWGSVPYYLDKQNSSIDTTQRPNDVSQSDAIDNAEVSKN